MKNNFSSRIPLCCGVALSVVLFELALRSHRGLTVWTWLGFWVASWIFIAASWWLAKKSSDAQLLVQLWIVAVAVRAVGFWGAPIFEDDWHRYLWDGRQFAVTGNPYDVAPRAHFGDETVPERFQDILSNMNHPDVPTIYGPVCQFAFALSYWIAPGQLWPLKLMLIAADLSALALLLKLTSPRDALLYAWCPLVIQETAFTAHVEMFGVALVVAALWARSHQRVILTGILCACAVAARIHAVLLVPFLLWPLNWRSMVSFMVALALLYSPFWIQGSAADFAGLKAFLGEWEFNSSVFGMVKSLNGWNAAKIICNAAFVVIAIAVFTRFTRVGRRCPQRAANSQTPSVLWTDVPGALRTATPYLLLVLAAFFALSAVVNPWYLLWLAPFAALRPSLTAFVAMATVSLSYLHGGTLDVPGLAPYDHPKWLRPLEYGLILATACFEWRRNLFAAKRKTG